MNGATLTLLRANQGGAASLHVRIDGLKKSLEAIKKFLPVTVPPRVKPENN